MAVLRETEHGSSLLGKGNSLPEQFTEPLVLAFAGSLTCFPLFLFPRSAYCAASVASLTNIITPDLFEGTAEWIAR